MGGKRESDVLGMDAPFAGQGVPEDETQAPAGMAGGAPRIARVRKEWDESEMETTPPWEVYGTTPEDVLASLEALGDEWGRGGGRFYAKYEDESDGSVTAVVYATFVKILPTWVDEEEGEPDARTRWDAMMVALDRHEQRHVDIAVEEVTRYADGLPGKKCSSIGALQNQAEASLEARQKKLDSAGQSDHGRKPGHKYGDVAY